MSHQLHFLEQTLRLEDAALERALILYREPVARRWLVRLAEEAAPAHGRRIAVALGPEASPGWVVLSPDGEVVTCLAPGMTAVGAHCVASGQLEEVLRQLPTLRGGDPDRFWTWRRLFRDLLDAGGWLAREAYEVLLRERVMTSHLVPAVLHDASGQITRFLERHRNLVACRPDRQSRQIRALVELQLWQVRHLVNLAGDLELNSLEGALLPLVHWHFGHVNVAAAVALGRMGGGAFDALRKEFGTLAGQVERAEVVRAIALIAARRPELAAATGRFLKRVVEEHSPGPGSEEEPWLARAALVSVWYLAAQGGRVAAEAVAAFHGRPTPKAVRALGLIFDATDRELQERWPPTAWRPRELYLPHEAAERERRREPRPFPDPMWEPPLHGSTVRSLPRAGRNEPCVCGSGRKAKRCCGTAGRFEEVQTGDLPPPLDAEERAIQMAIDLANRARALPDDPA